MNLSLFRYRPPVEVNEWFIAYTSRYLSFTGFVRALAANKIPIWLPSYDVINSSGNDIIKAHHLIFPGYLFISGINNINILSTIGKSYIYRVLPCPEKPYLLTDEEIAHLDDLVKRLTSKTILKESFEYGDYVRLLSGPFKHFVGKIESIAGSKITLSLQLFSRVVNVTTEFYNIRKISKDEDKG